MSAGICIMNRNAIALAADSAVTVGDHIAIHNSVNKLFSLSRVAPVGVIVYANAALMSVPIELIVKQYKKQFGNCVFSHLQDYVDNFLKFLEANADLFRYNMNEQEYVKHFFFDFMNGMLGDYNSFFQEAQQNGASVTEEVLQQLADKTVNVTGSFVDKQQKRSNCVFGAYIEAKYLPLFVDLLKKDQRFRWINDAQILTVCKKTCELFDTTFERSGFVGIAIAGYGEEEIFPHLTHIHISGVINSVLRYNTIESVEITERNLASIVPFAQIDVMQTFLFGINDRFIKDLAEEIPKQIGECIRSIDDACFAPGKKPEVNAQLRSVTGKIINHMTEVAGNNYMRPIIQSVASLPIEELALLAESMINITSLRRKVAIDNNIGTVGGPVDVAIISKGDGFIWLKRKHYFERKYNPQFFYSHYSVQKEVSSFDNDE